MENSSKSAPPFAEETQNERATERFTESEWELTGRGREHGLCGVVVGRRMRMNRES